jgi:uncharacterized membrane protein YcaP (DUF421 family)
MWDSFYAFLDRVLGLDIPGPELTFGYLAVRTVVVFAFGVLLVRFGDRRFLGRNAGFDILIAFVLGSLLSRGINGNAKFFPTLGASALVVLLHHLLAIAASRSHRISEWVKGCPRVLVRNGTFHAAEARRSNMTRDDVEENLRMNGNVRHLSEVAEARLERDGQVSVIHLKDV